MLRYLTEKFAFVLRKPQKKRKAFTLVEVLISATIFTIVSLIGINVFVNVIRIQRRVSLENAIYEDARVMMERIAREIRENTVDYEEYYNKASDFDGTFSALPGLDLYGMDQNPYGNRYGCYAKRFYNSGTAGPEVGDFGAYCNTFPGDTDTPESDPGCIVNKTTLDINTGKNPFSGYTGTSPLPEAANAFCDQNQITDGDSDSNCADASPNHNEQPELFLINAKGTEKSIIARKQIDAAGTEHALAILRLTGQDGNNDSIAETWRDCDPFLAPGNEFCCSTGFDCSDPSMETLENTLVYDANLYKGFVPISPTRTDVISLRFFVAPLEDPRKGFSETAVSLGVQQQPHVTVVLSVKPAQSTLAGFTAGEVPIITLQTTVTTRVYNEVRSYYTKLGVDGVCKDYN